MSAPTEDRPATNEERAAVKFEAIDISFDWTNEDWALSHLPTVRIASRMLAKDNTELQEAMEKIINSGCAPDTLERMSVTRDHLMSLAEMLDKALTRSFLVLDRLGYGPDNPPPANLGYDPDNPPHDNVVSFIK